MASKSEIALCKNCGKPKETYYRLWCPRCEKPEKTTEEVLSLFPALRYLEESGHPGIKERVWGVLQEDDSVRNDVYYRLYFSVDQEDAAGEQHFKDLQAIKRVFEVEEDSILVLISW